MKEDRPASPAVVIACGGTGGHLFPGLAVASQLRLRGISVTVLISPKEVDQQAVQQLSDIEIVTLPARAYAGRRSIAFAGSLWKSYRASAHLFQKQKPQAVLAMGGFISAAPVIAAKRTGVRTFLHESNTIPGRANRWLSWVVDAAFVGFPQAARRLHTRSIIVSGTPVRDGFNPGKSRECRVALNLDPDRPVVLIMGGSQGARGINELVLQALPLMAQHSPELQYVHLTGSSDFESVRQKHNRLGLSSLVYPFHNKMESVMGAASVAVSRAGASSLAELAAMRLPAILVPFPSAADNHQFHNAQAFVESGAAQLLEQNSATPQMLHHAVLDLLGHPPGLAKMREALERWHKPNAAAEIAEAIVGTSHQSQIGNLTPLDAGPASCEPKRIASVQDNSVRGLDEKVSTAPLCDRHGFSSGAVNRNSAVGWRVQSEEMA